MYSVEVRPEDFFSYTCCVGRFCTGPNRNMSYAQVESSLYPFYYELGVVEDFKMNNTRYRNGPMIFKGREGQGDRDFSERVIRVFIFTEVQPLRCKLRGTERERETEGL